MGKIAYSSSLCPKDFLLVLVCDIQQTVRWDMVNFWGQKFEKTVPKLTVRRFLRIIGQVTKFSGKTNISLLFLPKNPDPFSLNTHQNFPIPFKHLAILIEFRLLLPGARCLINTSTLTRKFGQAVFLKTRSCRFATPKIAVKNFGCKRRFPHLGNM